MIQKKFDLLTAILFLKRLILEERRSVAARRYACYLCFLLHLSLFVYFAAFVFLPMFIKIHKLNGWFQRVMRLTNSHEFLHILVLVGNL